MQWGAEESNLDYLASYRGNGFGWVPVDVTYHPFTTYRGDQGPNSGGDIRGWAAIYAIPFASLDAQKPADGAHWRLAIVNHDRDADAGGTVQRTSWPEAIETGAPSTWGRARFGLPTYSPRPSTLGGTVLFRHGLNGALVKDGNVGGYSICGGDPATFWTEWGNRTWSFYNPDISDFNVQNQVDIADWPCFAKYFITFPLDQLPRGKVIRSARFTINQVGNVSPPEAPRSLLQILTVAEDFVQASLTWNTAPLAVENVSRAWVDPIWVNTGSSHPREFDLGYAVAQAYERGAPLRLAVYSADRPYHSGKYFISSASWYQTERPRLSVEWGDP
jgi:hypothetical protein